jgi:Putative membrane protein insertion efficiency factor
VSVVNLSKPGEDDEEERRRRQEQAGQSDDPATDAAASGVGWCDGCDVPDCDLLPDCDCGGCDFPLLRVSTLLALVALVVPARTGGLVEVLIRGYRRWLTRFTPACPSHPSCSAYALGAVQTLGARRGVRAAARRACGREWH